MSGQWQRAGSLNRHWLRGRPIAEYAQAWKAHGTPKDRNRLAALTTASAIGGICRSQQVLMYNTRESQYIAAVEGLTIRNTEVHFRGVGYNGLH